MDRGLTGRYETSQIVGGEQVRAFVPSPLPPIPPLDLTGTRQILLEQALLALGRLDSVSTLLPDQRWLRLVGQCRPFLKWRLADC